MNEALEELLRMLDGVFMPNWNDLMMLLEAASQDEELAVELIQNVHAPTIRVNFQRELGRRLFNHLASAMGLVDHVRRISGDIPQDLRTEFSSLTEKLVAEPVIVFMQDLRNYTLHRSLPFLGHSLRIDNINTESQTFESEIELSVHDLLAWGGWKSGSRRYLEGFEGDTLQLRAVARRHGELVDGHNRWLAHQLAERFNHHLDEVNELILELETARFGLPREQIRALINERTARNSIPPPKRWTQTAPETLNP